MKSILIRKDSLLIRFVLFFLLTGYLFTPLHAAQRDEILILGKVSTNPKKHYPALRVMADYAASQMKDLGIKKAKVLIARDNQQMIRYLKTGKIDWVTETPFSSLLFEEKANAELLLLRWKKGVSSYKTVFFSRKDSSIKSLRDLRGKRIAFEDAGSTSAFFVPLAELKSAGLELVKLKSPREKVPDNKVGYVFSRDETNSSIWVHNGLVDAGAYSHLDWQNPDDNPIHARNEMHIFHRTKYIPRAIELVRGSLPQKTKQRLKDILLNMDKNSETKEILKQYDKTTRFEELTKMQDVRKLYKILRTENMW